MSNEGFPIWSLIAFFGLVGLFAFFSSSETAMFSLTRSQVDDLAKRTDHNARRLLRHLSDPRRLLIILLTGSTVVSILAATIAALVTRHFIGETEVPQWLFYTIDVVAVTLVLLIFGEILPKLVSIHDPLKWSLRYAGGLSILAWLLTPVTALLLPFTEAIARVLGIEKRKLWISEEEIKTLVEVGEEHGALETSEKELIHSIFEFGDTTVREIMVPRTDMVCLDVASTTEKLLEVIQSSQHTRIPIFDGSIDNIIGILHTKDLITYYPLEESFDLRKVLRRAIFVPEAKLIHELLKQLQEQRVHMAIAVDEYGGTAGLVTLEDVIEEIVGEIQDEHDVERPLWTRVDERTVVVDAKLDVETVNSLLGDDVIPIDQDFDSLGGFLLAELGDFPEAKTAVEYQNYEFIIEEVHAHRLGRVRIVKREALTESSEP
jgi:putative hemolysin